MMKPGPVGACASRSHVEIRFPKRLLSGCPGLAGGGRGQAVRTLLWIAFRRHCDSF